MKRQHDRSGHGQMGYHNFNGEDVEDRTSSSAAGCDPSTHGDNTAHAFHQHFRRPNTVGCSNDFLLDLLHNAPPQQQATATALYQHPGYQLLSAPSAHHQHHRSSARTVQSHAAYNHGLPVLAAAVAAGGHCFQQTAISPESQHNSFSSNANSFNFQNILSRGTVLNYGAPFAAGDLASTRLNEHSAAASSNMANDFTISANWRSQCISKLENDGGEHSRNVVEEIANVLHCAMKKEMDCSALKKPKMEPRSSEDLDNNDGATSGLAATATTSRRTIRRSNGSGGRGSRGSGTHGCLYCPKKFMDTQEAESHQEACVRQRPFDCTHCGKRFRQKTSLVQHLRIHTDNRPYQCRFCVRNFKQKSHLDQHERIHTGAKPYVCKFCNKSFRQKSGQSSHELTHTNDVVQQFQANGEVLEDEDFDEDELEDDSDDDTSMNNVQRLAQEGVNHHSSIEGT